MKSPMGRALLTVAVCTTILAHREEASAAEILGTAINVMGDLEISFADRGDPGEAQEYRFEANSKVVYTCVSLADERATPTHQKEETSPIVRTQTFEPNPKRLIRDMIPLNVPRAAFQYEILQCPVGYRSEIAEVYYTDIRLTTPRGEVVEADDVERIFYVIPGRHPISSQRVASQSRAERD